MGFLQYNNLYSFTYIDLPFDRVSEIEEYPIYVGHTYVNQSTSTEALAGRQETFVTEPLKMCLGLGRSALWDTYKYIKSIWELNVTI